MIRTQLVDRFIGQLHGLHTAEEFRDYWSRTVEGLGFSSFTYVGLKIAADPSTGLFGHERVPVYLTTVNPGWEEEYIRSAFFGSDPIVKRALARPLPIVSLDLVTQQELSSPEQVVMERAHDFSVGKVLTIPIHALGGEIAIMSLYCVETEAEFRKSIQAYQHSIHIMAIHFHTAVQDKLGYRETMTHALHLTPRELECLHWTAKGKTAWEIGQILHIAESTVHRHILHALEKLQVSNKTHAVAKAVTLGLARP